MILAPQSARLFVRGGPYLDYGRKGNIIQCFMRALSITIFHQKATIFAHIYSQIDPSDKLLFYNCI